MCPFTFFRAGLAMSPSSAGATLSHFCTRCRPPAPFRPPTVGATLARRRARQARSICRRRHLQCRHTFSASEPPRTDAARHSLPQASIACRSLCPPARPSTDTVKACSSSATRPAQLAKSVSRARRRMQECRLPEAPFSAKYVFLIDAPGAGTPKFTAARYEQRAAKRVIRSAR